MKKYVICECSLAPKKCQACVVEEYLEYLEDREARMNRFDKTFWSFYFLVMLAFAIVAGWVGLV